MATAAAVESSPLADGTREHTAPDWHGAPQPATPPDREAAARSKRTPTSERLHAAVVPGAIVAGKYQVEHILGEGGMGVVVEATHLGLGQRFAVKLLHRDLGMVEELCERFVHEARIAARLPGEHVARAVDVGRTHDGQPYLVMELLVGRDLGAELDGRGRLPVDEAVDYLLQACEGVAELHALGIVHRDLKPANLFLTRRRDATPLVKVLDFGIAKWAIDALQRRAMDGEPGSSGVRRASTSCGTPNYMAPEQIEPGRSVDGRCDQHALAVVLYELICGEPPFYGSSVAAILACVSTRTPLPLRALVPEAPQGLEVALARALSKRPADRFADLGEFARAIAPHGSAEAMTSARNVEAILAGAPPRERSFDASDPALSPTCPGEPPASRRWLRRLAELAAVGAAFGGVVALGLMLDAQAAQPGAARSMVSSAMAISARVPGSASTERDGSSPSTSPSSEKHTAARDDRRDHDVATVAPGRPLADAPALSDASGSTSGQSGRGAGVAGTAGPAAAPRKPATKPPATGASKARSAREVFGARR